MGIRPGLSRDSVLRRAKLVSVLLFCLINPFAGWAYLATNRARWNREAAPISDTLAPRRLAVLPLLGPERAGARSQEWVDAILSGLGGYDALDVLALSGAARTIGVERDPFALGRDSSSSLVLDARYSFDGGELRVFSRLVRVEDNASLWSQSFDGTREDFGSFCDETVVGVLRALATE